MKENETPVETVSEIPAAEAVETPKEAPVESKPKSKTTKAERDFNAEVAMLNKAYPQLDQIPKEVLDASVKGGKPVLAAYEAFRNTQLTAEIEALRAENEALKQNAEAAKRAPVTSVSEGGSPAEEALDPFIAILGE